MSNIFDEVDKQLRQRRRYSRPFPWWSLGALVALVLFCTWGVVHHQRWKAACRAAGGTPFSSQYDSVCLSRAQAIPVHL